MCCDCAPSQLNRLSADKIATVFRGVDLQNTGRVSFEAFAVWCSMHEDPGAASNNSTFLSRSAADDVFWFLRIR